MWQLDGSTAFEKSNLRRRPIFGAAQAIDTEEQQMRETRSIGRIAVILPLILIVALATGRAEARSFRPFWIPAAVAPETGACRFDAESLFPMQRKALTSPGQGYSYSVGSGCNVYDAGGFDVDAGFDWRESSDVQSGDFTAPIQGFFRVTYGAKAAREEEKGWSAALGMDDLGFVSGQNDFNVAYGAIQNRSGPLELELGGFAGTDTLKTAKGEKDPTGAMLAARRYIGRGEIGLEWRSGRNRDGYTVAASRVQFDETLGVTVGYAIANDRENMRDWVLLRISFSQ
jgi:hypothetical protein